MRRVFLRVSSHLNANAACQSVVTLSDRMKSSAIYARYDSITLRARAEGRLPETEMANEWQRHLPLQMLKNGNAFSAPTKSLSNFQLYAAHSMST